MPITAKLSRRFYEQFGDDVVAELVDWFNAVDTTYRSDLRELNELNFTRFDAKLEQRFAEQDARWERRFAQHDATWEQRFAQQDVKWERRFAQQDVKWEQRFAHLETKIDTSAAALRAEFVRLMFRFWTATMLALAGLVLTVLHVR